MSFKEYSLVLVLGLLMAAGIGFSYLTGNQHTYLVDGLRMIDPQFLKYDWFATQTTHYHGHFAAVLWLIDKVLPLDIGTVIINVLLIVLSIWALYILAKHVVEDKPQWMLCLLVALMILTQSTSVGQSYIYSAYLQPSSIASVFFIFAMVWFVKREHFVSGLFLLVSGYFHTNYLLLGLVVFGLSHLMLGREQFIRRSALNLLPACGYLLYLLPELLALSSSEYGEQSRYIYQHIRSPHHYIPMQYLDDFIRYFGISFVAIAGIIAMGWSNPKLKPLLLLFISLFAVILVGTALTTIVFVPFVSQLFPWRMAPFSNLLAQFILVVATFRLFDKSFSGNKMSLLLAVIGFGLILTYYLHKVGIEYFWGMTIALCLSALVAGGWHLNVIKAYKKPFVISWGCALCLCVAVIVRIPDGLSRSTLIQPMPVEKQALFDWVKANTASNSQFLIPPGFGDFRLNAQRAVVVDWKSPPIMPEEVMQWYERIGNITGEQNIMSLEQANRQYAEMDSLRLERLKQQYKVDFAVFSRPGEKHRQLGEVAFDNSRYLIIIL